MLTKIQMNFFPFRKSLSHLLFLFIKVHATSLLLNIKNLMPDLFLSLILLCHQECQDRVAEAEVVEGKLLRARAKLVRIIKKNREKMRKEVVINQEERTKKFLIVMIHQIVQQRADLFFTELNNHKYVFFHF